MDDNQSLSHMKWECKYHLVWICDSDTIEVRGGGRGARFGVQRAFVVLSRAIGYDARRDCEMRLV